MSLSPSPLIHVIYKPPKQQYLTNTIMGFMLDIIEKEKKKHKRDRDYIKTDSLLKRTCSNYIRLIGNADRKARIMLIVNSILLTLGVTLLTKGLGQIHMAWISSVILISSNLLSLFFCILSVRPEIKNHMQEHTGKNMLHYSKCADYSYSDYSSRLKKAMADNDNKIEAIIEDLYFYGKLLNIKYKLMKVAYRFFYWGLSIGVVSYLLILYFMRHENVVYVN